MARARKTAEEKAAAKEAKRAADDRTDEQIKAAKKENRDSRNAHKKIVKTFMAENELPEEVTVALNALITFKIRKGRSGISKVSKTQAIAEMFRNDTQISEMDLFMNFKIGRQAMTAQCRMFVKKFEPADRIWVTFDEDAEIYTMIAEGADAPKGWEGYVPVDDEEL